MSGCFAPRLGIAILVMVFSLRANYESSLMSSSSDTRKTRSCEHQASSPRYLRLRTLLAEAREAKGVTQAELARRLGRPQSYVSKHESGERRLDVIEFMEAAHAIGCDPEALVRALATVEG